MFIDAASNNVCFLRIANLNKGSTLSLFSTLSTSRIFCSDVTLQLIPPFGSFI